MGLSAPWLAYYGSTPASLAYPHETTYTLVRQAANAHPANTAYTFYGKSVNYSDFMRRIDRAAKGLTRLGITAGDKVTICMPNTPQALDCFYALGRIGAVANMIHPLSAPEEIRFYLEESQSKAILTLDSFFQKVAAVTRRLPNKCEILIARLASELPFPLRLFFPLTKDGKTKLPASGYTLWTSLLASAENTPLPPVFSDPEACAVILYSGGTTGIAKGVCLTHKNFNALGLQTIAASGYKEITGMKMLSIMPIFHGFGLGIGIHTALIGGACCILVPRFSVKLYAKILKKQKPELIPGVPTLFEALLRADSLANADLSFLRGIFSGGDTLTPELKEKVDAFLKAHNCAEQIREGYGTTECVTACCLTPREYARPGSIGIPFPDTYFQIVRPGTDTVLPPDSEGEICISGPTVMLGYLNRPEETADTLRRHGDGRVWLHTGDLGLMDSDGFVYFRQRIKRMIVTSGYNVYPSQLENILDGHEKVLVSCVIGVPDPYRIRRIRAYVVPVTGVAPTEALKRELLDYCAQRIAKYAMPREICFRTELPKTLVGKVAYRVLEEEAAKEESEP